MSQNQQREQLGSRIGFLLLAAGCAIGLGNVWRFPYIAGAYGGALFVFIYIGFLLAVGVPILVMEFSVGRAAQRNLGAALQKLEPKGSRWHTFGPLSLIGSYLLMMFYTTVAGWMLAYCWSMIKGDLSGLTPEQVGGFFGGLISDPTSSCLWMGAAVIFCFTVCGMGLRRGVERVVKFMMVGLVRPHDSAGGPCRHSAGGRSGHQLLPHARSRKADRRALGRRHRRHGTGLLHPRPRRRLHDHFRQLYR